MRIAQVAPLFERVPPVAYGGTERVVAYLTDALVNDGHEVTLFATADSDTRAILMPCAPSALRGHPNPSAFQTLQLERVLQRQHQFDIVHYHIDCAHFPISRRASVPSVTTLHGRLDFDDLVPLFTEFNDQPLVSISNAQRAPLSCAAWEATVYNGLPTTLFTPGAGRGRYLTFLGRISPEKRVDRAIDIARRAGIPLRVAAKVDPVDRQYFEEQIKARLTEPGIEFLGEVDDVRKASLLKDSLALLFPIDWPEPFGMVMIEALACGTPVIAYAHGSVPEILDDGETGFLVDSIEGAVRAVQRIHTLSRARCRAVFHERFTAERMATDYVDVYQALIDRHPWSGSRAARPQLRNRTLAAPAEVWPRVIDASGM